MDELRLDAATTALVVIDLQQGIVGMSTEPYAAADVVTRAAALARACRERGTPVFLVRVAPTPRTALRPIADSPPPVRGELPPDWSTIVPALGPEPGDVVVTKHQWGAFYGTDLEMRLRRGGVRTIVLCGIATTIGVESTARDAFERGFELVFAIDATSDRARAAHEYAAEYVFKRVGRVRTTAEVIAALG